MRKPKRVEWWDWTEGAPMIAERIKGTWRYFTKESGDVRWIEIPATHRVRTITMRLAMKACGKQMRSRFA